MNEQTSAWLDFEALFRRLSKDAGRETCEAWLASFLESFPLRDWERLERFRSFPLFLRNERRLGRLLRKHWVDFAQQDWAHFSALYSPADEERERASLRPSEYVLNPTAQILRLENELLFVYRVRRPGEDWATKSYVGDPNTAALIDPLLENGRLTEELLLREIQGHHGTGGAWREKLRALVDEHLILAGA